MIRFAVPRFALLFLASFCASAAVDSRDRVMVPYVRSFDPSLIDFSSVARQQVADHYDLVLILGKPGGNEGEGSSLGVFLQSRSEPGRFYLVGTEPGIPSNCSIEVKRLTSDEIVFGCPRQRANNSAGCDRRRRKLPGGNSE